MRLKKEDKNSLIMIGVILFLLGFIATTFHVTRLIPLRWIGIGCLFIEFVIIAPLLTKGYYRLYNETCNAWNYLPGVNMITIFPPAIAILCVIDFVVIIIAAIVAFLPADVLMNLFTEQRALRYGSTGLSTLYVASYVGFLIIGAGYCFVLKDVKSKVRECKGTKSPWMELVYYPTLFLPVISVIGLIAIYNNLSYLERVKFVVGQKEEKSMVTEDAGV